MNLITEMKMPTARGGNSPIGYWNVDGIRKFQRAEDGSYAITAEDLPETTFVLFYVDASVDAEPAVQGFIGLQVDDERAILKFPPAGTIVGDIDFGNVVFDGTSDVADSEFTLSDNADGFDATALRMLQETANFANAARMVMNLIRNADFENTDRYYTEKVSVEVAFTSVPELTALSSSTDFPPMNIVVSIYSHDYTTEAALFRPDGEMASHDYHNYSEGNEFQGATKWEATLNLSDFRTYATPGARWDLKDRSGTVLAQFDVSASLVSDVLGTPIIPYPLLSLTTVNDAGTDYVSSFQFNWHYIASDGTTVLNLEDAEVLEVLIGEMEFYIDTEVDGEPVTYMFREPGGGGAGGMSGDLLEVSIDGPPLPVASAAALRFGYRFGLCGVRLRLDAR